MIEKVKTTSQEKDSSKNIPESILELGRNLFSGELDPEKFIREVWRMSLRGELTIQERVLGLEYALALFPPDIEAKFTQPFGPQGKTKMMLIGDEESERLKRQTLGVRLPMPKRPSKGMRKHIRDEKAAARREDRKPSSS